jgi:two-component sensor histidine kinase
LADHLLRAYAVESDRITLETAVEEVLVDPDTAIHCGLIVLELLSNCLKHAFPEGRSGSIFVTLRRGDSGEAVLTVSNNGIGFPPEFDFQHSESFGLQLVRMLTEQLNGTIRLAQDEGSVVILTFTAGT